MRNAPSVVFPVGHCAFYGRLLIFLGGAALLPLIWVCAAQGFEPRTFQVGVVGSMLWLVWAVWARRSWRQSPLGRLQWDAQAARVDGSLGAGGWRWHRGASGDGDLLLRVELALDLQTLVLLRLRSREASSRWIWVDRSADAARWNDLRRALIASAA